MAASIADRLDTLTREAGGGSQHTASEASKGLRLLRLAEKRYDVVATNPPYLSGRKMNKRLATLMEQEYKEGKGDLYAAFIMRCQELLAPDGLMGMLTMHSFMFTSKYQGLRSRLRKEVAVETLAHFGGGLFAVGNPGTLQTAAFVLRREPDTKRREGQVGIYFRLVNERNADAKRTAFEIAASELRDNGKHSQVFYYQQSDFDAIDDNPWIYWMLDSLRLHFKNTPALKQIAEARQGLATTNNKRYLRAWWEVGLSRIERKCASEDQSATFENHWFPYMKGGSPLPWFGNQSFVVNWRERGAEIKEEIGIRYPYLKGKWEWVAKNTEFYFRRGVTWSLIATKGFAARISPGGFVFDVAGMTCFPPSDLTNTTLAVLNTKAAKFMLSALNPTINYQVGDIERLPVPKERSSDIDNLVEQCVEIARKASRENEATYEFVRPLWLITERTNRKEQLAALEAEINAEVSRLYELSDEDLAAIDRELSGPVASGGEEETESESEAESEDEDIAEEAGDITPADWARSWVSYSIGTVLGRFEIGLLGGLGSGDFPEATTAEIRKLIDPDGIMPCDAEHPQDIAARAFACLELMIGAAEARERVRLATDTEGDPVEALRGWLDRFTGQPAASFWKYHHQLYRKRPVYWPFQSPKKSFTIWVFHEKIGPNTLHTLKDLTDVRLNLLEREITDLRPAAATNRAKAKELDRLMERADDLREFSSRIKAHIDAAYKSCFDDGVVLNAAPLHDLLPSWRETGTSPNDPAKAWKALAEGKFEWALQAMLHWPERVTEACRSNRSFAIAHSLEHLCPAATPAPAKKQGRPKANLRDLL